MTAADEPLAVAHRRLFGRLVGWLFRMTGDLELAQDAVSAAFAAAVVAWRAKGVPESPEAWLRVTARNAAIDAVRRSTRVHPLPPESFDELPVPDRYEEELDDRLALLFVCAHPAIDARVHAPLMLQVVLGLDASRIGSMFLTSPATMGQRLSRAKAKVRDAGIRYRVPEPEELGARLAPVLQAIYACYGVADPTSGPTDERDDALRAEAVRLARLLALLLPEQPEALGLLALLLHAESRRPARVIDGRFVPLAAQDVSLWSEPLRGEADLALDRAQRRATIGRFQLEAAISAAHSARADGRATDWVAVNTLYAGLLAVAPSVGAAVAAASAAVEVGEPERGRILLDSLDPELVREFQPYWVCLWRVDSSLGNTESARAALQRAIGLTANLEVRRYLLELL